VQAEREDPAALAPLVTPLKQAPGVQSVAAFGSALHVAGSDPAALERAIAPWRRSPACGGPAQASLEDVFIGLIGQSRDNMEAAR
jgi:ABC-2 type transport system ATP-binding protein